VAFGHESTGPSGQPEAEASRAPRWGYLGFMKHQFIALAGVAAEFGVVMLLPAVYLLLHPRALYTEMAERIAG